MSIAPVAKKKMDVEYLYLFDDGKWSVYCGLYKDPEWLELNVVVGDETVEN